jgi:N-acetyl-anhydromuramyl-L-alanine amidase AmpD
MRYEKANWRPISTNFRRGRTRGAARVRAFVCHSQEGYGSLHAFFSNPARGASTHFWIGRDGRVEQYVDTDDTAWGNGERNRHGGPDPRIPWAAGAYANASVNDETVSCELEGRAGEASTPEQEIAGGRADPLGARSARVGRTQTPRHGGRAQPALGDGLPVGALAD